MKLMAATMALMSSGPRRASPRSFVSFASASSSCALICATIALTSILNRIAEIFDRTNISDRSCERKARGGG